MKVGILAGGLGTRLAEETELRPKPMVEIGGRPILWHIMKHYAHYGFTDFVIALGYNGEKIKRFMIDYCTITSHLTLNFASDDISGHEGEREDWSVELVDTGHQYRATISPFRGSSPCRTVNRRTSTISYPSWSAWFETHSLEVRPGDTRWRVTSGTRRSDTARAASATSTSTSSTCSTM
jgi:glucose-1-phosphate cytidylyltransferase